MSHKITTVQGLCWGSEAKGAIASMVAHSWNPDAVCTAWMPNAGHTAYVGGKKYVHSMLPIGALAPSVRCILLGPGSVIDLQKLRVELEYARDLVHDKLLVIHPQATIWQPHDAEIEKKIGLVSIGSTMKGSMNAVVRKMMRDPGIGVIARDVDLGAALAGVDITWTRSEHVYDNTVDRSRRMLVEGAQGFGLGIHSQFYPYATSRDVSTAQLFADCRLPWPNLRSDVFNIGVCRTFPIRVANRFEEGKQVGTSGGVYPGQRELDWKNDLGREPELTTVTKLPRRIFDFSLRQIHDAARIMQPDSIALTFCDYLTGVQHVAGGAEVPYATQEYRSMIMESTGAPVRWVAYGPMPDDLWMATEDGILDACEDGVEMWE